MSERIQPKHEGTRGTLHCGETAIPNVTIGTVGVHKFDARLQYGARLNSLSIEDWTYEVDEKPLPTMPGYYTIANNNDAIIHLRMFRLDANGRWSEPSSKASSSETEEMLRRKANQRQAPWVLTRLVREPSF